MTTAEHHPDVGGGVDDEGGRMTLADHLRELRGRLLVSAGAILLGAVVGLVFYQQILGWIIGPFSDALVALKETRGLDATINFDSIADPFTVPLRIALITGLVIGAPVWIYQLWAFIVPGLYRQERRWAAAVLLTATPLFIAGVVLCFTLLPKGLVIILGFTPEDVSNYVSFSVYFTFITRLALVFGVAFLLPVFVVLLNAVGVLTGQALADARRWIVMGIFVFAAVGTPTGDPFTMLALAVPMWVLFELAVLLCRLRDRRRARAEAGDELGDLDDDEASPTPLPSDLAER